ncbi:S1/P1 nuclease [Mucilaginibacter flavus]|uniref:S1/P1 nuclease n=1 Tax=Mucilaginibacter flavus TaxID=931504 RepID=UPI0025B4A118|nr:S1/P1 nuclease [Mucilaginibacter flavus]MDN3583843.1 S1/P1 nuclease [Mucilaginibacter flavus]
MRKYIIAVASIAVSAALISWGFKGHRAVATIAQKHLTSNTAYVVSAILKGQSMADVSTWADENRDNSTRPWHYLNLPLGLNHQQFVEVVSNQGGDNVYSALNKVETTLKDKASTPDQKNEALKYLIHLVGDAHQPMHVSRKEDKGGNTIQLQFDGKGTNLHSLWDSKLIDHEGLSEPEIAKQYDWANETQIKKWQADSPVEWLWESYQISTELYADIKLGQTLNDEYYKKYIQTIHLRIDQAGIRLAGELNKLYADEQVKITKVELLPPPPVTAQKIMLTEVKNMVGRNVSVSGKVYSVKDIGSMVLVNLGAAYPNQLLTLALKDEAKQLASQIESKKITVVGQVVDYRGKPEIIVIDPKAITIEK